MIRPSTTANTERTFSALKKVRLILQLHKDKSGLNNLTVMSIKKSIHSFRYEKWSEETFYENHEFCCTLI